MKVSLLERCPLGGLDLLTREPCQCALIREVSFRRVGFAN